VASRRLSGQGREFRGRTAELFHYVEYFFYIAVAAALGIVGAIIFGHAVYTFVTGVEDEGVGSAVLQLLDQLLLVFIVAELIHTVRAVINDRVLISEPFLIVGIVASIRRLIVVTAEVPRVRGDRGVRQPHARDRRAGGRGLGPRPHRVPAPSHRAPGAETLR
jgi:uncharacterized membrane protein (DUF373 family)